MSVESIESIDGVIVQMRRAAQEAERARSAITEQWSAEARFEEEKRIQAELDGQMTELQKWGNSLLEQMRKEADLARDKAQLSAQPHGVEAWAEAASRQQFVVQDLEAVNEPAEIVEAYQLANAVGDEVGRWLVAREGLRLLRSWPDERKQGLEAREAAEKLENLAFGLANKEYQAADKERQALALEMDRARRQYWPDPPPKIGF
jgi:hypothetical protein